jgi:hypothetical protein
MKNSAGCFLLAVGLAIFGFQTQGGSSFCSASAYITVPDCASLESTTGQLTVECWFNRQASQWDWSCLVSKSAGAYTPVDYELRFDKNQPVGTIVVDPSYPIADLYGSAQPTNQVWHQVRLSSNPLTIGAESPGFRNFSGYISEVRISRIARYFSTFTPKCRFSPDADTVALYHLDEGAGSTAYDASGNGNNGDITGSSVWSTNVPPCAPPAGCQRKADPIGSTGLASGLSYQPQTASDLSGANWDDYGAPFIATDSTIAYLDYGRASDWDRLCIKLSR